MMSKEYPDFVSEDHFGNISFKSQTAAKTAGYPDNNPKTAQGRKKPALRAIPPVALLHLGAAMADGERKYGLMNWRDKFVSSSVYYDAMFRHMLSWWDGEDKAEDSGVHHLGHVMACCAILLDAEAQGTLNDDRPEYDGKVAELIKSMIAEKLEKAPSSFAPRDPENMDPYGPNNPPVKRDA